MQRPGNLGGRQNRLCRTVQLLRIQLRHPPVVFARRIGGHIRNRFGIRCPVKLVDVQIGWRSQHRGGRLGRIHRSNGNALNLDSILADHTCRRLHRRQRPGWSRRPLHIQERHLASVRRKGRRFHVTLQLGQPPRRPPVQPREIEIGLHALAAAIGKERQRLGIRRPRDIALVAVQLRLDGCCDPLAFCQVVQRGHVDLGGLARTFNPRQPLAVRGNRNLAHRPAPVQPFQNFFNPGAIQRWGSRSALRQRVREAKNGAQNQGREGQRCGTKGLRKQFQRHRKMLSGGIGRDVHRTDG